MASDDFARQLLTWYDRYGRKDLPWQRDRNAYRVWVSEIMLQQTQVSTVIPYFERFVAAFPTVQALAKASLDEVLGHWSGLGYYARGRNLHRAARQVVGEHGGELPRDIDALAGLPGIGRSTAGAILALAHDLRHPILDGNVKRVLARYHRVEGWPGESAVSRRLWELAERHTPHERVADYTQAIMDLGATLCSRTRPDCGSCPVAEGCAARAAGRQADYPARKAGREKPTRESRMLLIRDGKGHFLLLRRPPAGVWGGLWSLPEVPDGADIVHWCRERLQIETRPVRTLSRLRHTFSHFHLDISPLLLELVDGQPAISDQGGQVWFHPLKPGRLGIPAPVQRLLTEAAEQPRGELNGANG
ncbi:MAG: A/G-specific adenine glycosylase [Gammaproteobacteria bacterium]